MAEVDRGGVLGRGWDGVPLPTNGYISFCPTRANCTGCASFKGEHTVECWRGSRRPRRQCFGRRPWIVSCSRTQRGRPKRETLHVYRNQSVIEPEKHGGTECETYSELSAKILGLAKNHQGAAKGCTNRPGPFPAHPMLAQSSHSQSEAVKKELTCCPFLFAMAENRRRRPEAGFNCGAAKQ